jgi:hypothetical protein
MKNAPGEPPEACHEEKSLFPVVVDPVPGVNLRPGPGRVHPGLLFAPRRLHRRHRQPDQPGKTEILLQAYSFTSKPIAQALIQAHKRGVRISAVLDKSNRSQKYSAATFLRNMGIPVFIDDKHAIAHNKIMIIDDRVVITGSFNFTTAAENRNAENLLILEDLPEITRAYRENFQNHLKHAVPYLGREE